MEIVLRAAATEVEIVEATAVAVVAGVREGAAAEDVVAAGVLAVAVGVTAAVVAAGTN